MSNSLKAANFIKVASAVTELVTCICEVIIPEYSTSQKPH